MGSLTGVDRPVMAFDSTRSELAIATGDGRVKLFSVAQQRLLADLTQGLAGKGGAGRAARDIYTCLAWGAKGSAQRLLFVGTTSGQVKCYDVASAMLRWAVAAPLDGSVVALACSADGSSGVLAVGATGNVAVLDISSGVVLAQWRASKHQLSRAAMLPGGRAIIAGSAVGVFDASSGSRLHKWTGHATLVTALAVTDDGQFCCSAAEGERSVAVWSLEEGKPGKLRHKSAVAQLNLDQPATHLSVAAAATDSTAFQVAAVTQGGSLRLFECAPSAGGAVAVRKWGASAGGGASSILSAALEGADGGGANLVLAAGTAALPAFQRLRADKAEGGAMAAVPVELPDGGALVGGSAAAGTAPAAGGKAKARPPAAVLGPGDDDTLSVRFGKRPAAAAGLDEAAGLPGAEVAADGAAAMEADDAAAVGDDSDAEQEEGPTLGERVAALQEAAASAGFGAPAAAPPDPSAAAAAFPSGPIKADSLAVLLTQALQSSDRALLERCLSVRNADVLANTVKRLAPPDAAAFLRAAVQRLQYAPAQRAEQLASWIRAVLLHHTAYLTGAGGAAGTLGALYQLIEARLATYQPLLALSGRLDLVLANAKRAGITGGTEGGGDGGFAGPLLTLQVGSDGGVEVEDAFGDAGLGSDDGYSDDDDDSGASGGSDAEDAALANGMGSEDEDEYE